MNQNVDRLSHQVGDRGSFMEDAATGTGKNISAPSITRSRFLKFSIHSFSIPSECPAALIMKIVKIKSGQLNIVCSV